VNTDADYVECDFLYEYIDKTPVKLITKTGEVYGREDMMVKARCNAWNKIIKRDLIERTGIKYPVGLRYEDVEFFCKIIPHVKKIALAREPLYHYIQRKASITHDQNEKNRDLFTILTNVLSYYQENGLYEAYHERLEYLFIKILLGGSFFRAVRIENSALRKAVLSENWHLLNDKFPAWKKNRLLRRGKGVKNLFFKKINRFTYPLCAALLRIYYGAGGK